MAARSSAPNTWPAATAARSKRSCPILKKEKVAAYNWGLVDGKTQTKYPWATWQMPILGEPHPWHHDIFHTDGRPYREEEVKLIRKLTDRTQ